MPIYEYQCNKCSKIHEIWQKINDTPPDKCTECGGSLHKLVSLSSFQLKGEGWYVNGYSNAPKKKDEKENIAPEKNPISSNKNNKGKTDSAPEA